VKLPIQDIDASADKSLADTPVVRREPAGSDKKKRREHNA
jgi:hypothetical protein